MAKLFWLLLIATVCASSQTVEGRVVNLVTGGGIAGAKVTLEQGGKVMYSAVAGADGSFRIQDVSAGAYEASYSAARYAYPFGAPPSFRIQVTSGTAARVEGGLIPHGRISGRVIDGRGDAVPKARVELTTAHAFWIVQTDASGVFELNSLIPGESSYTIAAAPPADWKLPDAEVESRAPRMWAWTFYPGVAYRRLAAPLLLRPGGELSGIEIKLMAVTPHAIRGVVFQADGAPASKIGVNLFEAGPRREAAAHVVAKEDGTFEFPAVAAGDWRVSAGNDRGGAKADEWVELKSSDLEGVTLRLSPPFAVGGRVILEAGQGMSAPKAPEVLLLKQNEGQLDFLGESIHDSAPDSDGHFQFDNIYAATYLIAPGPAPALFYLDTIRIGEREALGEVELLSEGPQITIVYKTNGGTVRGTVEKCAMGQVMLLPQDRPGWRASTTRCDEAGHFEMAAIRPGEYYALALPSYIPLNVDAARGLVQSASRVTVRAGEVSQVDLTIIQTR